MAENNSENKGDDDSYLSDSEICQLSVTGLRNYLRRHKQFISGKKSELIERAKGVKKLGLRDANEQEWEDLEENEVRQEEKLVTQLGERLPDPDTLDTWSDNWLEIPDFYQANIYDYFVLRMKTKRPMRSAVYVDDRHVHSLQYHKVQDNNSHCFVKCKVIKSLPSASEKKDPDHVVWICMAKVSGQVLSADCKCTAGRAESCNHIASLMYCLAELTQKRKDGTISSTSQKCKWNNPRKRKLSPKKSHELKFKKYKFNTDSKDEQSTRDTSVEAKCKKEPIVDVERFRNKLLSANSKAGWLTFFESERAAEEEIPAVVNINFNFRDGFDLKSEEAKIMYQNEVKCSFSTSDRKLLEEKTRGQSKNEMWIKERKVRITSSHFSDIFKHVNIKDCVNPDNLLRNLLYAEFDNQFLKWGRTHEPAARMKYKLQMKKQFKDIRVTECGLLILENYPYIGASPDGLVRYTENGVEMKGTLEIKCPASEKWKFQTPEECARDSRFYCNIVDGKCVLKRSHKYYIQIQGQLGISGREWCDFVLWTLNGFSIERIYFDKELWEQCLDKLKTFYFQCFLPELFSTRVKRGLPLFSYAQSNEAE